MNAEVLTGFFTHRHNRPDVVEQEYEAAKRHYAEVLKHRDPLNAAHNARFQDAIKRLDAARERWLAR